MKEHESLLKAAGVTVADCVVINMLLVYCQLCSDKGHAVIFMEFYCFQQNWLFSQ